MDKRPPPSEWSRAVIRRAKSEPNEDVAAQDLDLRVIARIEASTPRPKGKRKPRIAGIQKRCAVCRAWFLDKSPNRSAKYCRPGHKTRASERSRPAREQAAAEERWVGEQVEGERFASWELHNPARVE